MNLRPKILEAKAPVPVMVGQRWRDRDTRMGGRVMLIYEVKEGNAFLRGDHGTTTRIGINSLRRKWMLEE